MPVSVSYPGLYLEELPSNARSIVAAPTSITVFAGYTHPFKTLDSKNNPNFNTPVRIFSYSDYERYFGGIYVSGILPADVAHAVNQYFINGGSDAYVVGLEATFTGGITQLGAATQTLATTGGGIVFTAREPTDAPAPPITITINNVKNSDTADYTITYGTRVESYRGVKLADLTTVFTDRPSSLISVAPSGGSYGTAFTATTVPPQTLETVVPVGVIGPNIATDFANLFATNKPLDKVDIFNLLVLPGISSSGVLSDALAFAERKQAFLIMDPPAQADADDPVVGINVLLDGDTIPKSQNGALYFPYLNSLNPVNGQPIALPPSGFVAGIFARTDTRRGVWKAPAGLETIINNTTGVVDSGRMNDPRQGVLNLSGVNCLRSFPGVGTVVFGARTLVSHNPAFQQNMYVPVRRMTLFIEQTLLANLKWVVFEPNDEPLWHAIRMTIENFMLSLFNQQALQGSKPSEAFMVQCDSTTTTPDDINTGRVNIVVGFAPLKPAEFVIIKIAQLAGQTQS